MSHDQHEQTRPAAENGRVKVDARDAAYWCRKLGCTEAALLSALNSVGPIVEDVERHLKAARKR
jgi:hypothetical protein